MATSATEVRSEKAAYWSEHVAAWQRSGLSQGAYCRQQSLSQSSLSYWRKRLGVMNNGEDASFVTIVPVPLLASAQADMATAPELLLVHVGDGFRIGDHCTIGRMRRLRRPKGSCPLESLYDFRRLSFQARGKKKASWELCSGLIEIRGDFAEPVLEKLVRTLTRL